MTAHPFHIGRTLGDAARLLKRHWQPLLVAFVALRMLPRVLIGEDLDDGLIGTGESFLADMLRPLGSKTGGFLAEKILEIPNYVFLLVSMVILLREGNRSRWSGLLRASMTTLLFASAIVAHDGFLEFADLPPFATFALILVETPLFLALALSEPAAADENRWPVSAMVRSARLVRKGPFRLLVLFTVVLGLFALSKGAENLMLNAIPVTDGTWFDWVTTIFQECISGFYLPFESAVTVAAFLHLRRRADGEKPEDVAAVFD